MHFGILKSKLSAALFISGLYFILWSLVVLVFPSFLSRLVITGLNTPLIFWDLMGIITLILGVGLILASFNPFRHWPIILLVSLFHLAMICGFIYGYTHGIFNGNFIKFVFFNHVIWLVPNVIALYLTYKRNFITDEILIDSFSQDQYPLELFETVNGENIAELSNKNPIMLIFLRHFGCPFCKDSMLRLNKYKFQLSEKGIKIVVVYMVDEATAQPYLQQYELDDVLQVSDPEEIFYKSFKLKRGSFTQLFGLKVWLRWIELGVSKKLFNTKPEGNVSQMPGIFLLKDGKIVEQFNYNSIADIPDYDMFLHYNA